MECNNALEFIGVASLTILGVGLFILSLNWIESASRKRKRKEQELLNLKEAVAHIRGNFVYSTRVDYLGDEIAKLKQQVDKLSNKKGNK